MFNENFQNRSPGQQDQRQPPEIRSGRSPDINPSDTEQYARKFRSNFARETYTSDHQQPNYNSYEPVGQARSGSRHSSKFGRVDDKYQGYSQNMQRDNMGAKSFGSDHQGSYEPLGGRREYRSSGSGVNRRMDHGVGSSYANTLTNDHTKSSYQGPVASSLQYQNQVSPPYAEHRGSSYNNYEHGGHQGGDQRMSNHLPSQHHERDNQPYEYRKEYSPPQNRDYGRYQEAVKSRCQANLKDFEQQRGNYSYQQEYKQDRQHTGGESGYIGSRHITEHNTHTNASFADVRSDNKYHGLQSSGGAAMNGSQRSLEKMKEGSFQYEPRRNTFNQQNYQQLDAVTPNFSMDDRQTRQRSSYQATSRFDVKEDYKELRVTQNYSAGTREKEGRSGSVGAPRYTRQPGNETEETYKQPRNPFVADRFKEGSHDVVGGWRDIQSKGNSESFKKSETHQSGDFQYRLRRDKPKESELNRPQFGAGGYNSDYVNLQANRRGTSLTHDKYKIQKKGESAVKSYQWLQQLKNVQEDKQTNESTSAAGEGRRRQSAGRRTDYEEDRRPNHRESMITDGYTEYFSQGCDFNGQLGHGQEPAKHDRGRQVNLPKSLSFDILIKSICCGAQHTLLLSQRGELFSIGSNDHGQLGLNDRSLEFSTAPLLVQEMQNMSYMTIKHISCGAYHSALVTRDGLLYAWGANYKGQCGVPIAHSEQASKSKIKTQQSSPTFPQQNDNQNDIYTPAKVSLNFSVEALDLGFENTGVLTDDGHLFIWGSNSSGQLGDGRNYDCSHAPHELAVPMGTVSRFSVGFDYVLFEAAGTIYGVGANQSGQITSEVKVDVAKPMIVPGFERLQVNALQAGSTFSAAISDGCLVVWGNGPFGKFEKPRKLEMPGVSFDFVGLSKFAHKSEAFGVARTTNGKVYAWGSNAGGQLGTGDNRARNLPEQVTALKRKSIATVALGQSFVVMLGQDVSHEELQRKKERRRQMKKEKQMMRASGGPERKSTRAISEHKRRRSLDVADQQEDRRVIESNLQDIRIKQEYQEREKDYLEQIESMRREVAQLNKMDGERDKRYEHKFDDALQEGLDDQKKKLQDRFASQLQKEMNKQLEEYEEQRRADEDQHQKEVERLHQALAQKDHEMQTLLGRVSQVETEAEKAIKIREENDDLQRQIEVYERTLSEMETDVQSTSQKLHQVQKENDGMRDELSETVTILRQKEDELKGVTDDAREQLQDAVKKNDSLLEIVRRRDDELRDVDSKNKDLEEEQREARRRCSELEQRLKEFAEKNRELDDVINAKLVERAERYRNQVKDILNRNDSAGREALINCEDPVRQVERMTPGKDKKSYEKYSPIKCANVDSYDEPRQRSPPRLHGRTATLSPPDTQSPTKKEQEPYNEYQRKGSHYAEELNNYASRGSQDRNNEGGEFTSAYARSLLGNSRGNNESRGSEGRRDIEADAYQGRPGSHAAQSALLPHKKTFGNDSQYDDEARDVSGGRRASGHRPYPRSMPRESVIKARERIDENSRYHSNGSRHDSKGELKPRDIDYNARTSASRKPLSGEIAEAHSSSEAGHGSVLADEVARKRRSPPRSNQALVRIEGGSAVSSQTRSPKRAGKENRPYREDYSGSRRASQGGQPAAGDGDFVGMSSPQITSVDIRRPSASVPSSLPPKAEITNIVSSKGEKPEGGRNSPLRAMVEAAMSRTQKPDDLTCVTGKRAGERPGSSRQPANIGLGTHQPQKQSYMDNNSDRDSVQRLREEMDRSYVSCKQPLAKAQSAGLKPQSDYRSYGSGSNIGGANRIHKVDLVSEDNASLQNQIEDKLSRIQKIFEGQSQNGQADQRGLNSNQVTRSVTDTATLTEKTPRNDGVRDALRA